MTNRISWSPIAPLGDGEVGMDFGEIDGLRRQWLEVKEAKLRVESSTPQAYSRFNEELSREWAIETGIIEGLYELDRGITQTLIRRGWAILGEYVEQGSTNIPSEKLIAIMTAFNILWRLGRGCIIGSRRYTRSRMGMVAWRGGC